MNTGVPESGRTSGVRKDMKIATLTVLFFAMLVSACSDPAANKPRATMQPAAQATADDRSPLEFSTRGTAIPFGPETSTVEFLGSKVTGRHEGGYNTYSGIVDLVDEKAEASSVLVEIDMTSVFTDAPGLTDHLKTDDFFAAAKFPTSTFSSTRIVADAAKDNGHYSVTGDLEMRGVKRTITFPAAIAIRADHVAVKAEFVIDRKEFGIAYAGKQDDLIRNDVVIILDIKALRKK